MSAQLCAMMFGVGVVVAVTCIVSSVYNSYRRNRQYNRQYEPRNEPTIDRSIIGSCCFCSGDVIRLNGYEAPCKHYVHYTCATAMTRENRNKGVQFSDICPECRDGRGGPNQDRAVTRRTGNAEECANCQRRIEDGQLDVKLECNHQVHETCWERMTSSGLTTCPRCMDF